MRGVRCLQGKKTGVFGLRREADRGGAKAAAKGAANRLMIEVKRQLDTAKENYRTAVNKNGGYGAQVGSAGEIDRSTAALERAKRTKANPACAMYW